MYTLRCYFISMLLMIIFSPLIHLKPQHNNNIGVNKELLTFKTFLSDMVLFNSLKM